MSEIFQMYDHLFDLAPTGQRFRPNENANVRTKTRHPAGPRPDGQILKEWQDSSETVGDNSRIYRQLCRHSFPTRSPTSSVVSCTSWSPSAVHDIWDSKQSAGPKMPISRHLVSHRRTADSTGTTFDCWAACHFESNHGQFPITSIIHYRYKSPTLTISVAESFTHDPVFDWDHQVSFTVNAPTCPADWCIHSPAWFSEPNFRSGLSLSGRDAGWKEAGEPDTSKAPEEYSTSYSKEAGARCRSSLKFTAERGGNKPCFRTARVEWRVVLPNGSEATVTMRWDLGDDARNSNSRFTLSTTQTVSLATNKLSTNLSIASLVGSNNTRTHDWDWTQQDEVRSPALATNSLSQKLTLTQPVPGGKPAFSNIVLVYPADTFSPSSSESVKSSPFSFRKSGISLPFSLRKAANKAIPLSPFSTGGPVGFEDGQDGRDGRDGRGGKSYTPSKQHPQSDVRLYSQPPVVNCDTLYLYSDGIHVDKAIMQFGKIISNSTVTGNNIGSIGGSFAVGTVDNTE